MEIEKLLDECKAKLKVESDYALAKELALHSGLISDYRNGKRVPDAYACSRIAGVLKMDEMLLIAHFEALSAKNPQVKEYWQKKLERLGGMAAAIIMAFVTLIVTSLNPSTAQAAPLLGSQTVENSQLSPVIHYAK